MRPVTTKKHLWLAMNVPVCRVLAMTYINKNAFAFVGLASCCLLSCGGDNACYSPTSNLSSAYESGAVGCACNSTVDKDVCVQGTALMCMYGHWQAVEDGPCMPIPDGSATKDTAADTIASPPDGSTPKDTATDTIAFSPDVAASRDNASMDITSPADIGASGEVAAEASVSPTDVGTTCSLDGGCPAGTICQSGITCALCFSPTIHVELHAAGNPGCACNPTVDKDVCVQGNAFFCYSGQWTWGLDGPCMPGPDGGAPEDAAVDSAPTAHDVGATF